MSPPINRDAVQKDVAELVNIRSHENHRELTADEKHRAEMDVCKCADRAERRAKGER